MNHPDAWCTNSITLGCESFTKKQAIAIMKQSTSMDMTVQLAAHLIAAKLNTGCLGTNPSCVSDAIAAADQFLCANPVNSGLQAKTKAWQNFSATFQTLADYNEGLLCAPHRD